MTICTSCFREVWPDHLPGIITRATCQKCQEPFMRCVEVDKEEFEEEVKQATEVVE